MNLKAILAGAVSGLLSAAAVDFAAFRSWKSASEALRYDWGVALWRWFQGALLGAMASAGFSGVAL